MKKIKILSWNINGIRAGIKKGFIKSMNKFLYICKCCLLGPIYTIVIIAMMILLGTFLATAILINMIINIIKSFIQGIKNLFNNTFQ